jgi:hypothetical protein
MMLPPERAGAAEQPLVFVGRLDETDVVHIRRYSDYLLLRRSIRWVAGTCATILAAPCAWGIVRIGPDVLSVSVLVAWAYLLFVLPFEREWSARRQFRRRAAEYLETKVTLSAGRVALETEEYKSEFVWRHIGVVAETPHGLLFCNTARQVLFWLQERLFADPDAGKREKALQRARDNGVSIRQL